MRGHAALRNYYEQWVETFESIEATAEEIRDAGDAVVVAARVTGQMKESHAQVEMTLGMVCTLSSGKVIQGREYATYDEALEAAGLSE
jgi:ketosteroid isomerase-like protein